VAFTSTPTSKVRSLGTPERKKPLDRSGFGIQQLENRYSRSWRSNVWVFSNLRKRTPGASQLVYNVSMSATVPNATAMIHVRVDQKLKTKAAKTLEAMGLSFSDVVRLLLKRIAAEKALPFEVRVPNPVTRAAMEEVRRGNLQSASSVRELMDHLNAED